MANDRSAIEAEAARLFHEAQQSGDWTTAYAWVEADPAHGYAFAKVEAGWDLTARLREVPLPEVPEDIAGPAGRFEALFNRRAVAGLLATAALGIVSTVTLRKWLDVRRFRTGVGEARSVALADGTRLRLNTDSAVEVALDGKQRLVRLIQGEVRFDVAHDPSRPFVVDVGRSSFRVLGTVFDIRTRSELTELTVLSGKVAVDDDGKPQATVEGGSYAAVSGGTVGVSRLSADEMARRTDWEQGIVSFNGETLEQAVAELNRYRRKPLVIGAPQIGALRVGGTVKVSDSDTFLEQIGSSFGVRAIPGPDSVLLMPVDPDSDGSATGPVASEVPPPT